MSSESQRNDLDDIEIELRDLRYQHKEADDDIAEDLKRSQEVHSALGDLNQFLENLLKATGRDRELIEEQFAQTRPDDVATLVDLGQTSRMPAVIEEIPK